MHIGGILPFNCSKRPAFPYVVCRNFNQSGAKLGAAREESVRFKMKGSEMSDGTPLQRLYPVVRGASFSPTFEPTNCQQRGVGNRILASVYQCI